MTAHRIRSRAGAPWSPAVLGAAVLAALLVVTAAALVPAPASAAGRSDSVVRQEREWTLRLLSQAPPAAPGGTFEFNVRMRGGNPPEGAELVVAVYPMISPARRAEVREQFVAARDDDPEGNPLQTVVAAQLRSGLTSTARFGVITTRGENHPEPLRLLLREEGVYPLRVTARDAGTGDELAAFTTFAVRLPAAPEDGTPVPPLVNAALVLPFTASPMLAPDGTATVLDDADLPTLESVVGMLEHQRDVPVTLLVRPETVVGLSRVPRSDLVRRLKSALTFRQVLATTYVGTDIAALLAGGSSEEVRRQLTAGEDALAAALLDDLPPDRRTLLAPTRLDAATLLELRGLGFTQAVVPEGMLARDPVPSAPGLRVDLDLGNGNRFGPVLVADGDLASALRTTTGDDIVLRAQHLISELAVIGFEHRRLVLAAADENGIIDANPGRSTPGIVLWAGEDWDPRPESLDAIVTALLRASSVVSTVTLDDAFATAPEAVGFDSPVTRRLDRAAAAELPDDFVFPLALTRISLASFASFVDAQSPLLDDLGERMLMAASTDLDDAGRVAYLDAVNGAMVRKRSDVEPPEPQTITLTAREGSIRFSVEKLSAEPLTVQIRLISDKLDFTGSEGGAFRRVLVDERTPVEVPVRVLANGSFPVTVEVSSVDYDRTPNQGFLIGATEMTVRSIAVPGLGIALTVGAFAFLLLWWISHARKDRRARAAADPDRRPLAAG